MVVASSLMYEFRDKEQNVYVHTQIPSPLKDGGEISLNGDVSIRLGLHGFFFPASIDLRLNYICYWTACWHSPNTAGRCI